MKGFALGLALKQRRKELNLLKPLLKLFDMTFQQC